MYYNHTKISPFRIILTIVLVLTYSIILAELPVTTKTILLNFISPDELTESLSLSKNESGCYEFIIDSLAVQVRLNQAINQVILTGPVDLIDKLAEIINNIDVSPRQIIIEAKIVEIDNEKASELGLDWQYAFDMINSPRLTASGQWSTMDRDDQISYSERRKILNATFSSAFSLGEFLKLLQQSGSGKIINIPHIVTTNNKKGTIFDGQTLKYVIRQSSYVNIYETQEINAGLMLSVTPSLGESGFLKLKVIAKFTALEFPQSDGRYYTDFPVESGQTLENTVIVKNSESILLGGFKKSEFVKSKRKFPVLGWILPFLFSRDVNIEYTRDILIILTPKIIDMDIPQIPIIE